MCRLAAPETHLTRSWAGSVWRWVHPSLPLPCLSSGVGHGLGRDRGLPTSERCPSPAILQTVHESHCCFIQGASIPPAYELPGFFTPWRPGLRP